MLPLLVQVLPWRAVSAMQRGPKHLISSGSFVKESSLEGGTWLLWCVTLLSPLCFTEKGGPRRDPTDPGRY